MEMEIEMAAAVGKIVSPTASATRARTANYLPEV